MEKNKDLGLLFVRLALAIVFIFHGWIKISGLGEAGDWFFDLGAPMPVALAVFVAFVEFFGGIAILLGWFSRIASGLVAIVMATAILEVKFFDGLIGGFELELTLLLCALAIVFGGPGEVTVSRFFLKKK